MSRPSRHFDTVAHGAVVAGPARRRAGAYGLVRHPLYLGAYLIWAGLGVAFQSLPALGVFLQYVVPAYAACMRSEESMLLSELGEAYASYRRRVPMVVPRISRGAA